MTITVGNRCVTIRIALTRSTCYASYDRDTSSCYDSDVYALLPV